MKANRGVIPVLWLAAAAVCAVLYAANLYLGEVNQDEGWYLYAARQVAEGRLPYVDFATTQGPVMPFVYAWAQGLVDRWGVAGGRLFTVVLGVLTAGCTAWLACRVSGVACGVSLLRPLGYAGRARVEGAAFAKATADKTAGKRVVALVAFAFVGVNVYQTYFTAIVKTYALGGLLLVLGFLCLSYAEGRRAGAAAFLSGFFLALAAGTRSSAGVVIPVVFVGLCLQSRRAAKDPGRPRPPEPETADGHGSGQASTLVPLSFALGALLTCGVIFVPFAFKAPRGLWFALVEYHSGRQAGGVLPLLAYKAGFVSRVVQAYFMPISLVVAAWVYRWRRPWTVTVQGRPRSALLWLSVAAVTLVHFLTPFPYDDYQALVFPVFAAAAAVFVTRAFGGWGARLPLLAVLLCMASAFSSPINQSWFVGERDRIWWPLKKTSSLAQLREAGARLRGMAEPGDLLLTQDTYLAVESGLAVPEGLELGPFSYFPDWPRAKAEACHVLNRAMLTELLRTTDARLAAFSGWGLSLAAPSVMELPGEEQERLRGLVEERYRLAEEIERFGQASTTLRIYGRPEKDM